MIGLIFVSGLPPEFFRNGKLRWETTNPRSQERVVHFNSI